MGPALPSARNAERNIQIMKMKNLTKTKVSAGGRRLQAMHRVG